MTEANQYEIIHYDSQENYIIHVCTATNAIKPGIPKKPVTMEVIILIGTCIP